MFVDVARDANPARFGQGFHAGGDIHTIAEQIITLDDDIAQADADAQYDPAFMVNIMLAFSQGRLDFKGTLHGIGRTGEFNQDAVTGVLEYAPAILFNQRIKLIGAQGFKPCQRPSFVLIHQTGIAHDVGGENRRQPPPWALFSHLTARYRFVP